MLRVVVSVMNRFVMRMMVMRVMKRVVLRHGTRRCGGRLAVSVSDVDSEGFSHYIDHSVGDDTG